MFLLPQPKKINIKSGFLKSKQMKINNQCSDDRIEKALSCFDVGNDVCLTVISDSMNSEGYSIFVSENEIVLNGHSLAGTFYAIQTLKQLFKMDRVPCLEIYDEPDMKYRGLYHDVTRGKVPKIDTLKELIDKMAYYKMNSLQLYVEHTFPFKETEELIHKTGFLSVDEIKELDDYCYENFIDFIPSIATFGHMYEILEQEKYNHLRVLKDYKKTENFWKARMQHHTIDPQNEESYDIIKSLINQYYPHFSSEWFNICGDETFDLENSLSKEDAGYYYVNFVKKIIEHVQSHDKKIMMWADILLSHPETIEELPGDIIYLNWNYSKSPSEEGIIKLSQLGRQQIVCPGTSSWSRLCEDFETEELNITRMIDYGHKHSVLGVLNTNWGDFGNPASIELSMYGIVLGATKSWNVNTELSDTFYKSVNELLYGTNNATDYLKRLSNAHSLVAKNWNGFCYKYFEIRYGEKLLTEFEISSDIISSVQKECMDIITELTKQKWGYDDARNEMILCAEGICVLAQLGGKMRGIQKDRVIETKEWLSKFRESWMLKNKESELPKIEEMMLYIDNM